MNEPIRIFIVDDHPVVLAGLRSIEELAPDMKIAGAARTSSEAHSLIAKTRPAVVLLDVRLGGASGLDLCRELKALLPEIPVIFLTSYSDEQLVLSALEAGAEGYLLKESDTPRLIEAIRRVLAGEIVFDPAALKSLGEARTKSGSAARDLETMQLESLTVQERRLLAEVAKGRTDKEVAQALGLTPKTARNYLDRIFAKLNVHTRTEAAMVFAAGSSKSGARD